MVPINAILESSAFDKTIRLSRNDLAAISKKYLAPVHFSKKLLFNSMYNGKTVVFKDYPIGQITSENKNKVDLTLDLLRKNLKKNEKIFIRYGINRTLKKVTIDEVIERWARGRSRFGVTDLHFRHTRFFEKIDADSISYFNLLPLFPDDVSFLEMLTLVISSKGIFSDSHSDDGDGSNHCIVGKKLWFAWDHAEGKKAGLQDCTYDPVYDQASFSLKKFASLKSAHWFLVSEGQTLFMPGNFTHKVVTLENYIGFGSFYLSLPNYMNSLKRWVLEYSSDVTGGFIETMNTAFIQFIKKELPKMSAAKKKEIGFDYFIKGIKTWKTSLSQKDITRFMNNSSVKNLFTELAFITNNPG